MFLHIPGAWAENHRFGGYMMSSIMYHHWILSLHTDDVISWVIHICYQVQFVRVPLAQSQTRTEWPAWISQTCGRCSTNSGVRLRRCSWWWMWTVIWWTRWSCWGKRAGTWTPGWPSSTCSCCMRSSGKETTLLSWRSWRTASSTWPQRWCDWLQGTRSWRSVLLLWPGLLTTSLSSSLRWRSSVWGPWDAVSCLQFPHWYRWYLRISQWTTGSPMKYRGTTTSGRFLGDPAWTHLLQVHLGLNRRHRRERWPRRVCTKSYFTLSDNNVSSRFLEVPQLSDLSPFLKEITIKSL